MSVKKGIYKTESAKQKVIDLYESKVSQLKFPIKEIDIDTTYGKTRVIKAGKETGKTIVLFHGVHAGSPLTLESIENLIPHYSFIAIDTIGQATKSAETTINIKDNTFAKWATEVLDQLSIEKANFIGISYGAYILQKMMIHTPERIEKSILVVPSGLANGKFWPSFTQLTLPLLKFKMTQKDKYLNLFLKPFVPENDQHMHALQKILLTGVKMDYRRPTILKQQDIKHFSKPIYLITAENDVFFPSDKTIEKAQKIFSNLKEVHTLQNAKHMPSSNHLSEIEEKIASWINNDQKTQ